MIILLLDLITLPNRIFRFAKLHTAIFKIVINSIKLILFWAISHNITYASANGSSINRDNKWEISVMPIIKGMPAVDNSDNVSGARLGITHHFYHYRKSLELGVDLSLAYLKTSAHKTKPNFSKSITIASPAVVARWNFAAALGDLTPYVVVGVGPSFLSNDDFEGRKLGMRFSFQDIIGVGFRLRQQPTLNLGLHLIHYSNASLSKHNRGITTPVSLQMSYGF